MTDKFPSTVEHIVSSLAIAKSQVGNLHTLYERCKEERDTWKIQCNSTEDELNQVRKDWERTRQARDAHYAANKELSTRIQQLDVSPPAATRGEWALLRDEIKRIGAMVSTIYEATRRGYNAKIEDVGDLGQL